MPQVPLADGIYPWVLYLKNLYLFLKTNPGSSVLLPGKSHGRRSLVGCSREESDMTERLHFHFSLSCIGEGNGNPFQCSCQENPRDGGAWWAAVSGVAQSRTRLKRLSSSSSSTRSSWPRYKQLQGCGRNFFLALIPPVGWHHRLNGHESEQIPGDGKGQGSLAWCSPCGHKESDMT